MERADDAIGIAKPAVAHRSKTAKNKFFIELLENELLETNPSKSVCKV
jgi:hypothetical protein